MKSRLLDLSPQKLALALGALLVLLAVGAWLFLVSPNRDKASSLSSTIKSERSTLTQKLSSAHAQTSKHAVQHHAVSQALMTARALPNATGIPQIVLQLSRIATEEKVTLDSISPQAPIPYSGYTAVPLSITLTGDYFTVQNFLQQLLKQVTTSADGVRATGRLYDVLNVSLAAGSPPPQVTATITLDAFTYSPVIPTAAPTATTTTTSSALG
jgi:Tfp pilus assembly protein PilO